VTVLSHERSGRFFPHERLFRCFSHEIALKTTPCFDKFASGIHDAVKSKHGAECHSERAGRILNNSSQRESDNSRGFTLCQYDSMIAIRLTPRYDNKFSMSSSRSQRRDNH